MIDFFSRLDNYMRYKGLNDNKITIETGISNGLIGKARVRGALSQENISKILYRYSELDANWLLTGKGEMLRTRQELAPPIVDTKDSYIIELQKDKIRSLEKELHDQRLQIEQLKKQLSSVPASTVGSKSVL